MSTSAAHHLAATLSAREQLYQIIEEAAGNVTPDQADWLEANAEALLDDVDGLGADWRSLEDRIAAREHAHRQAGEDLAVSKRNLSHLQGIIHAAMERTGRKEIAGRRFTLKFHVSGGQRAVTFLDDALEHWPAKFVKDVPETVIPATRVLDRELVRGTLYTLAASIEAGLKANPQVTPADLNKRLHIFQTDQPDHELAALEPRGKKVVLK